MSKTGAKKNGGRPARTRRGQTRKMPPAALARGAGARGARESLSLSLSLSLPPAALARGAGCARIFINGARWGCAPSRASRASPSGQDPPEAALLMRARISLSLSADCPSGQDPPEARAARTARFHTRRERASGVNKYVWRL